MKTFEFNTTFSIETHSTAMGTRMAPSYANQFLAEFETDVFTHAPTQPNTDSIVYLAVNLWAGGYTYH